MHNPGHTGLYGLYEGAGGGVRQDLMFGEAEMEASDWPTRSVVQL